MATFQRKLMMVGISSAFACLPTGVFAQGASAIEEIIVSARKREESIYKVPVVMSALTAGQIEDLAISDLFEVSDTVPGLMVNNNVLGIGAQVSMRGIGTNVFDPTIDQSVSLVVDGMQMTQGTAYQAALFDMQQIEVLKGPQALFFGKASPAGAINVTTADPTDEFEVILKGGREMEAETSLGEFIVSGPLTETLGARLATQYTDDNGYFKNEGYATPYNEFTGAKTPESTDLAQSEVFVGRLTLVWEPTEDFSGRFKYNHTDTQIEGDAGQPQLSSCPDGIRSHPTGLTFIGNGEDCKLDDTYHIVHLNPAFYPGFSKIPGFESYPAIRNNGVPYTDHEQDFGTLELNYDVSDSLLLTSVTGMYDTQQSSMINAAVTTADAPLFSVDPDFERTDVTQEFRLTSDFADSPVNFMVGAFYQDADMDFFNNLGGNIATLRLPQLQLGTQKIDIESKSLFGQLIWQATPELEISAGTRWTDEQRDLAAATWVCQLAADFSYTYPAGCTPYGPVAPAALPLKTPKISSDNYSPEFTVTYTPTDELTFFAALKQAYKSGSFNTVTMPAAYVEETSYGDERIRGGEAGIKARLLDQQLSVNVAYYNYDYKDMQVGANDNTGGVISIVTQNAASSEINGIEADMTYMPIQVEGLTLRSALNWNDANFKDFPTATCWGGQSFEEGCNQLLDKTTGLYNAQDLSGEPLTRAPDFTANFGFDYEQPIAEDKLIFRISSTLYYSDEFYTALQQRDDMIQDSYLKSNLTFALRDANDLWEVALIGNNLSDKITTGNCAVSSTEAGVFLSDSKYGFKEPDTSWAQEDELLCNPDKGRQIWLQFTFRPAALFGS